MLLKLRLHPCFGKNSNEELGIAPEIMAEATMKVTIPMAGRKASMNVAGAFAIMAFCLRSAAS